MRTLYLAIVQNPQQMARQLLIALKMIGRRIMRLPISMKVALGVSLCICLWMYGSVLSWMLGNRLKDRKHWDVAKCPACYGTSACDIANEGAIWLTGFSRIKFLDYVNVKNVYYGVYKNKDVVLKKLGKDEDIVEMESRLCEMARQSENCDVSQAALTSMSSSGTDWILKFVTGLTDMTACPTERLLLRVMDRYKEKLDAIDLSARERAQLVSTLMINQDPILLQSFPKSEGWPFPEYFGACGRYTIMGFAGLPLQQFYHQTWLDRVTLSLKLLRIAQKFTENDSQFSLYWKDMNYENFVVNDKGEVVVVDVENIVVVDKWQIKHDKLPGWDVPYHSDFNDCPGRGQEDMCLPSVTNKLCTSHTADHNYYVLCRNLLSSYASEKLRPGGFLHDIPHDIDQIYHISELAERCAKPENEAERMQNVRLLMKALTDASGL